ncbi:Hpt domain-containing protein [Psychrobacter sp. CAL346-MNA-CIBAN-0220]|uniref:Hpt domain-containing protein n=1 Tax=Psychrobacter sp. CAL346-MNA-CIBAN-0220 TaxID=3140457 RepID=UPI00331A1378
MNNQPNKIATLEWLLPLFDQHLSQVTDSWLLEPHPDFEYIAQHYRQLYDALTLANLPSAFLAARLSLLAETGSCDGIDAEQSQIGQFSHQLLRHELTALTAASDTVTDTYSPAKLITSDVIRYDDNGEIAPTDTALDSKIVGDNARAEIKSAEIKNAHVANAVSSDNTALQAARKQLKPDNFDNDEEINDIFVEEATEIIADLKDFLDRWQQEAQDLTPLMELHRGFHTLKGSGRMVGCFSISEMAGAIENLLNRVLNKTLPVTNDVVALVIQTIAHLPVLVVDFTAQRAPSIDPAIIILQSSTLSVVDQPLSYGMNTPALLASSILVEPMAQAEPIEPQLPTVDQHRIPEDMTVDSCGTESTVTVQHAVFQRATLQSLSLPISDLNIPTVLEPFINQSSLLPVDAQDADPATKAVFIEDGVKSTPAHESQLATIDTDIELLEIFSEEADEIIISINQHSQLFLNNINDVDALQILQRGLHTLKGGARMVAANSIADLAHQMETVYEQLATHQRPATKMVSQLLRVCHDWLADAVFILKQQVNPPAATALIAALQQFSKNPNNLKYIPSESLRDQRNMSLATKMQPETGCIVETINERSPMTGSLVKQQQDGLLSSRIVSFTRLKPRLERVVRQTADELNKSVELTIINAADEMDRTILERMTSPLEHLLRNAVDHGIESAQTRLAAGKDYSGHITLEVLQEDNDLIIYLTDDGRGINVDAVRKKAIVQGLIEPNDNSLSDFDIMQTIFNAGLSTTQEVTQISGRGIGLNVVITDIRQLGGVISVTSEAGQGSRFTIRVPLR